MSEIPKLPESYLERGLRKCREEPIVPLGCLATVGFLSGGLHNFFRGQANKAQYYMRGRVIAQGITIAAIIIGGGYFGIKPHNRPSTVEEKLALSDTQKK